MKSAEAYAALSERVFGLFDEVTRARAILTAPTVDPVPPPPPPPNPPPADLALQTCALDPARLLLWQDYQGRGLYARDLQPVIITGPRVLRVLATDMRDSTKPIALEAGHYTASIDGKGLIPVDVKPGATQFEVPVTPELLGPGYHELTITGGIESSFPLHVAVPPIADDALVPVMQQPHDTAAEGWTIYRWVWAPSAMLRQPPAAAPRVTVPAEPFDAPLTKDGKDRPMLCEEFLVPLRVRGRYWPRVTGGVLHTANKESYYLDSLTGSKYPPQPLYDGVRGIGNWLMATHLQFGRTGGLYGCDPWRLGFISPEGTVKTIAGWRHKRPAGRPLPATNANLRDAVELVGDWSAIPVERHGAHELWGFTFDARTLAVDPTSKPIPNDGRGGLLEQTHHDPVSFLADSQNNRILQVKQSRLSHEAPAVVTEFLAGLADGWDNVAKAGVLYVGERQDNRIAAYDIDTKQLLRVVVQGPSNLAKINSARLPVRMAPISTLREADCVLPEGLAIMDDWLYYASAAQGQVRRVHLVTGKIEVRANFPAAMHGLPFAKIAVSDGTFGPRHTVFVSAWTTMHRGRPIAFLPDGTVWGYNSPSGPTTGPGWRWDVTDYSCAVAVGHGMLAHGCSAEGLMLIRKARPTDIVVTDAQASAAMKDYLERGLHLTHGQFGFPTYGGLGAPWGKSEAIDRMLAAVGHVKHGA